MPPEDIEEHLSFEPKQLTNGWTRSDTDLTLYYQPTGMKIPSGRFY
ncbi:MAG: hypothetical protein M2R45_01066 [Verrucomicrobia subdivision 3 bacterium]|nr:hypothetical protein [Limisphaerales bacterium]MCS1414176.1 hypothetical protein [Limisphaerales bacterium]